MPFNFRLPTRQELTPHQRRAIDDNRAVFITGG
ncbi:hypothetical protein ES705_40991 [subsurface metagenome]